MYGGECRTEIGSFDESWKTLSIKLRKGREGGMPMAKGGNDRREKRLWYVDMSEDENGREIE